MSQQENILNTDKITEQSHKGKKKKHSTECSHKKRSYHTCGLCGSEDLIIQGVYYCNVCDEEQEILIEEYWNFLYYNNITLSCNHKGYRKRGRITVKKCLTCGSTEGPLCPSCGKQSWKNIQNETHCKHCRYMS